MRACVRACVCVTLSLRATPRELRAATRKRHSVPTCPRGPVYNNKKKKKKSINNDNDDDDDDDDDDDYDDDDTCGLLKYRYTETALSPHSSI